MTVWNQKKDGVEPVCVILSMKFLILIKSWLGRKQNFYTNAPTVVRKNKCQNFEVWRNPRTRTLQKLTLYELFYLSLVCSLLFADERIFRILK